MQRYGIGFCVFVILFAYVGLSVWLFQPPPVVSATSSIQSFSAERAMQHVWRMAEVPHATGTAAHTIVRDYLLRELRQRGLQVAVQDTVGMRGTHRWRSMSRVQNIIARLPGTDPTTTLLVLAHYDTQPNTPGAADDAAACAAILETIDALQAGAPLRNDILFVLTDNEEAGLIGAEAFVSFYPQLEEIDLVLNFEARGNAGPSTTFEISPQNGWLMEQYALATPYPMPNSMTYEVYLLLPNDTDYTLFREQGKAGLNNAFIDGFANYHSMTDTPDRLSQRSLQHHGSNMLGLVGHFGQLDWPEQDRAPDAVFFNPLGTWLVIYPAAWDLPLMLVVGLLLLAVIQLGVYRQRFTYSAVAVGTGWFVLALLLTCLLGYSLNELVLWLYPHYGQFYANNFFNSANYFLAFTGLTLAVCGGLYAWAFERWNGMALGIGAALIWAVAMVGLRFMLPTGTFMAYWPLLFFLLAQLLCIGLNVRVTQSPVAYGIIQLLLVLPGLGVWAVTALQMYRAFSLGMPLGGIATTVMMIGIALPVLYVVWLASRPLVWLTGSLLLLLGFAVGHLTSHPSPQQPIQSYLAYYLDKDEASAKWVSAHDQLDDWTTHYFRAGDYQPFGELPGWDTWAWQRPVDEAAQVDFPVTSIRTLTDALDTAGLRTLRLRLEPQAQVTSLYWVLADISPIRSLVVDGRTVIDGSRPLEGTSVVHYMAPAERGINIELILEGDVPFMGKLVDRRWNALTPLLPEPRPVEHIFGPGRWSNVVFVQQSFSL